MTYDRVGSLPAGQPGYGLLDHPDQADFYTAGRAFNEAAFL
ncbi:hypothetical protein [Burkholderia sp. RF4-BP95]|nr:hypothetical protein [Burkholderia sp. RF4-BP95]